MTRRQDSAKRTDWKELMAGQEDFLRPLIQEVVRQVLEAEMEETVGAEKGERTPNRQGYRAGYYGRTLVPAPFNEFYPKRSGATIRCPTPFFRRSTSDRILFINGHYFVANDESWISDARRETSAKLESVQTPRDAPDIFATAGEGVPARRCICFVEHIAW